MDESADDPTSADPEPPGGSPCSWESPLCPPPWVIPPQVDLSPRDPPPRPLEEFFCSGPAPAALAPLAGALAASSRPHADVVKQGYLGRPERRRGRYFVLRAGSHTGPSRLEWYKNHQNFTAAEKSGGKAAPFSPSKRGSAKTIYLRDCVGVSRGCSTRSGHTVALFAQERTVELVAAGGREQEEWYLAVKGLMEEERRDGGGGDEDDGYCTLPPTPFYREVWPVTVRPGGLGGARSLAGEGRLCLTASSLVLVRVGAAGGSPSATIPLLGVRRFGHLDGAFYLELGRAAPGGAGEVWMEAKGQAAAQSIHEAVREALRAMRVLPSFDPSPTSAGRASQRCPPQRGEAPPTGGPGSPGPASDQIAMETGPEPRPGGTEGWDEGEGPGYMVMSPQASRGSSPSPPDDYVVMVSPRKRDWPARPAPPAPTDSPAPLRLFPSPPRPGRRRQESEAGTPASPTPAGPSRGRAAWGRGPASAPVGRSRFSLCLPLCLRDDAR